MSGTETNEYAMSRNRTASFAVGMGVFVALLMVMSGFSAVFLAGGTVSHSHGVSSSANAQSTTAAQSAASAASASGSYAARQAMVKNILAGIHSHGVPNKYIELPNFLGTTGRINGPGAPASTIAPAPMGIGDYGVMNTTGVAAPYTYNTSSFKASTTINSIDPFYMQNDGPDSFGLQLNTILYNVTVGNSVTNGTSVNDYWTQNVPSYTVGNHELYFVDNVWNFSNGNHNLPKGALTGNGTLVAPQYYYDVYPAPTSNGIIVAPPFTLTLYNNASTASATVSPYKHISTENNFGFTLTSPNIISYPLANGTYVTGHSLSYVYDQVFFKSSSTAPNLPTPQYRVSGKTCGYTVGTFCIPDDAEISAAIGPGGGSTTNLYGVNETLQLQYWSGASYMNVRSAWDTGSETGETTQGVSEWWTTPGVVNMGPGPSVIYPLWNASGLVATSGSFTMPTTVTPSNAFLFFTPPGITADAGNMSWAPNPMSGNTITYNLPRVHGAATVWAGAALMSNYDQKTFILTVLNTSLTVSLKQDMTKGIYTPLQAFNNAQLANISSSGAGTAASPYMLFNNSAGGGIVGQFSSYNDYLFPSFPGTMIVGTTAYVDDNGARTWNLNYVSPWLAFMAGNGLPVSNNLAIEAYNAVHLSIWGGSALTGWFGTVLYGVAGFPFANVLLWNTTSSLVGSSTFANEGTSDSLMVYNQPTVMGNNVIWGNNFQVSTTFTFGLQPAGFELYSSGNTVYNNIVNIAPNTADTPTVDLYDGAPVSYTDTWNIAAENATAVNTVNGYGLTGNILGMTWQGGNFWYNCTVPYDNSGKITNGFDYLPLCTAIAPSVFTETGLPAGASWTVNLDNGMSSTTTISTIYFILGPGNYAYTVVVNVIGWTSTPSTGTISVGNSAPAATAITINKPHVMNTISFIQSGAPGTWSIVFGGTVMASDTSGDPITTVVPNGTYYYSVSALSANAGPITALLIPTPSSGNVTVSGAAVSVVITYVALPETAAITSPISGGTITAGTPFTVSYSYKWMAATNATLLVTNTTKAGVTSTILDKNVFVAGGVGAGSFPLSLGAGNVSAELILWATSAGSPTIYFNSSVTTAKVVAVSAPTVPPVTTYVNTTQNTGGLSVGALGAILIVVGIVVGFLVGFVALRMNKPKAPSSPAAWDEKSQAPKP